MIIDFAGAFRAAGKATNIAFSGTFICINKNQASNHSFLLIANAHLLLKNLNYRIATQKAYICKMVKTIDIDGKYDR